MLAGHEKPPSPSHKEKLPEIRSLARHPWELTLQELIEQVRRDYGIDVDYATAAIFGGLYLSKGKIAFPVALPDPDEILPVSLLLYFCRLYRVPPEDFGLPPEEEDDD
jgi:hypothetical protein